jgi:hypothetical protein
MSKEQRDLQTLDYMRIQEAIDQLKGWVPEAIEELGKIMTESMNENTRLRAIELLFKLTGVDQEGLTPSGQHNRAILQVLQLTAPMYVMEARQRGLPIPNGLEEAMEGKVLDLDGQLPTEEKEIMDTAYRHVDDIMNEEERT